jgi:hypothetical protein
MDTNAISSLFENKDFESVAQILKQNPPDRKDLGTEEFIEIFAIASFTYLNIENYEKSLMYSSKLRLHTVLLL